MNARIINNKQDLDVVLALLKSNKLPYQDITIVNSMIISYYHDEVLVGSGGLEFYGEYALLRSVAVDESHRGKSLGKQITADLINRARSKSVKKIFLLTETAQAFFLKLGFTDTSRDNAPTEVKASSEFTTACPASAVCMVYTL